MFYTRLSGSGLTRFALGNVIANAGRCYPKYMAAAHPKKCDAAIWAVQMFHHANPGRRFFVCPAAAGNNLCVTSFCGTFGT
ncbi:MAG: hypothetical protein CL535_01110 [Ahrensia sp.]|nr:hypothetical protein [Ahrensia sp.]